MLKKYSFLIAILFLFACRQEPGEGGYANIQGKVWVINYNATFTSINNEYAGADEDIYIIYGNDINYSDRQRTGPDGAFQFKYLRKGKYTLYIYSKDSTLQSPTGKISVLKKVEITEKKENVNVGLINILN